MKGTLFVSRSQRQRRFWVRWWWARAFDRGRGVAVVALLLGFDRDVPLRPWPRLWIERRPNGDALAALVCCGVGVMVQTSRVQA